MLRFFPYYPARYMISPSAFLVDYNCFYPNPAGRYESALEASLDGAVIRIYDKTDQKTVYPLDPLIVLHGRL